MNVLIVGRFSHSYRKCQCPNGDERIMTMMGCKQGGVPRCRAGGIISNDGPFGLMDPMMCSSTKEPLSAFDFVSARTQSTPSCICSDGHHPVCINRSDQPLTFMPHKLAEFLSNFHQI